MAMLSDTCAGVTQMAQILRHEEKGAKIADFFHFTLIMVPGKTNHIYTIDA
jgi:hypothetical protein